MYELVHMADSGLTQSNAILSYVGPVRSIEASMHGHVFFSGSSFLDRTIGVITWPLISPGLS